MNLIEYKKEELVKDLGNNVLVLNEAVNELLTNIYNVKKQFESEENEFRKTLLKVMIDNGILSSKLDNFTLSVAMPKPTIVFDKDKLIENEEFDTIQPFAKITTTKVFDIESLQRDHPELVEQYTTYTDDVEIDLKKLEKLRPDLYHKYTSVVQSDKEPSLRITEKK